MFHKELVYVLVLACCSLSLLASVVLTLVLCLLKRASKFHYRLALAIGVGLSVSSSAGIWTATEMKAHIFNTITLQPQWWRLKVAVVVMRQFDFIVIWYLAAMYANFVQRSYGKPDQRGPKHEPVYHFLFWSSNIVTAGLLAWLAEGRFQDILDYTFCIVGAVPLLLMIPATIYIARKSKRRLRFFLTRLILMLAITAILFAKWIVFSYIYVAKVVDYQKEMPVRPYIWYIIPFFFLDGFLMSVLLVTTPELLSLYKKRISSKRLVFTLDLPVSREEET